MKRGEFYGCTRRSFRRAVFYRDFGRCVVTGTPHAVIKCEAAHIRPNFMCADDEERFCLDNGLLLRADYHRTFDLGLWTMYGDGEIEGAYPYCHSIHLPRIMRDPEIITDRMKEFLKGHNRWFETMKEKRVNEFNKWVESLGSRPGIGRSSSRGNADLADLND